MKSFIDMRLRVSRGDWQLSAEQTFASPGFWLLSGASGAGKTTLLRAIAGLEPKATGHLRVGEQHWQTEHHAMPTRGRRVGYVSQAATVFTHLRVQDNLHYASGQLASAAVLETLIDAFGLAALRRRSAQHLSGGERQRLAMAMALSRQPDWLLLDEPTNAIDQQARIAAMACLRELQQQWHMPVLMISHQVAEAEPYIDDHFTMAKGRWQR